MVFISYIFKRSQIQIATRTFHFVLPPPDPEATPFSPPPSTARDGSRSPSVDITDLSPGPSKHPLPTSNVPPVSNMASPATSKASKPPKKRKRPEPEHHPPDKMPPKPLATYSVLCYRAITSLGGKASLQEVIQWMIENYEWYRLNAGGPWEVIELVSAPATFHHYLPFRILFDTISLRIVRSAMRRKLAMRRERGFFGGLIVNLRKCCRSRMRRLSKQNWIDNWGVHLLQVRHQRNLKQCLPLNRFSLKSH